MNSLFFSRFLFCWMRRRVNVQLNLQVAVVVIALFCFLFATNMFVDEFIQELEKEQSELEMCKTKKVPQNVINDTVKRLYDEAERRGGCHELG